MLKKPTKSIEQQQLDALKYAEKLWGPNIGKLSPSPSPSQVLSPSPPLPLPHKSSNCSSVKENLATALAAATSQQLLLILLLQPESK